MPDLDLIKQEKQDRPMEGQRQVAMGWTIRSNKWPTSLSAGPEFVLSTAA